MNPGTGAVVFWVAVLAAMFVALLLAVVFVRRWMFTGQDAASTAFTLHDIARMRDTGEITVQEHDHLRAQMITGISRATGVGRSDAGVESVSRAKMVRDGIVDRSVDAADVTDIIGLDAFGD